MEESQVKSKLMPDQKLAGTVTADRALEIIGDDPQTLVLAIQLMDRILARRKRNRTSRRNLTKYRLTS